MCLCVSGVERGECFHAVSYVCRSEHSSQELTLFLLWVLGTEPRSPSWAVLKVPWPVRPRDLCLPIAGIAFLAFMLLLDIPTQSLLALWTLHELSLHPENRHIFIFIYWRDWWVGWLCVWCTGRGQRVTWIGSPFFSTWAFFSLVDSAFYPLSHLFCHEHAFWLSAFTLIFLSRHPENVYNTVPQAIKIGCFLNVFKGTQGY